MKRPLIYRLVKSRAFFPLLAGGMALQINLSGCDPEVRNAALTGISSSLTTLTSSLINAFFLSLLDAGTSAAEPTEPVVRAAFDMLWGVLV